MKVLDENIGFVRIFIEKLYLFLIFYFVLGIILGHFRHPKSILFDRKIKILRKDAKQIFDFVIDFLIEKYVF